MTATSAVMASHLLTWQRHFRRHGGSGWVSDRSCPCMSCCMCNGPVFSLIIVRERDDMSGRIWWDLCFQHIVDQSNITATAQMKRSESLEFCLCAFFFVIVSADATSTALLPPLTCPHMYVIWWVRCVVTGQVFFFCYPACVIYSSLLRFFCKWH